MNRFVKSVKTKLQNTSRLKLLTCLGIVATASILVVGTASAHSRYVRLQKLAQNTHAVARVNNTPTTNKSLASIVTNKKTSKIANKPSSNDLKNCLQARTEIIPREKAMADEQKRHFDELKEIQANRQKSGDANPESYKQELSKENDLNRKNMQDIMKPPAKNPKPQKC